MHSRSTIPLSKALPSTLLSTAVQGVLKYSYPKVSFLNFWRAFAKSKAVALIRLLPMHNTLQSGEKSPSIRIQCCSDDGDNELGNVADELTVSRDDLVRHGGAYFAAMLERSRMTESLTGIVRLPDLRRQQLAEFLRAALRDDYGAVVGQPDRLWQLLRLAMRFQADGVLDGCCRRLADCAFKCRSGGGGEDDHEDAAVPGLPLACAMARLAAYRVAGASAALDRLLGRLSEVNTAELAASQAWSRCRRRRLHADVLRRCGGAAVDWPTDWLAAASAWSERHGAPASAFLANCLRPGELLSGEFDNLAFSRQLLVNRKTPLALLAGHARTPRNVASSYGLVEIGRLLRLRSPDWACSTPCKVGQSRDLQELHGYCLLSLANRWLIVGGENAYGRGMWVREVREFQPPFHPSPTQSTSAAATSPELGRLLTELPYPVRDHCVCTDGRRLFIAGGATMYRKLSNRVCYLDLDEAYTAQPGAWSFLPPLPIRMYGLRSAATDDLLIVYHSRTPHIVFCWDLRGPSDQMWTQLSAIDLLSFLYFNRKSTGEKALLIDFLQVKSYSFVSCGRHMLFSFANAVRGPSCYPRAMVMHFGDFRTLLRCFLEHRAKPEPGGDPLAPFARFYGSREFRVDFLLVREAEELASLREASPPEAVAMATDNRDTVWLLESLQPDWIRVSECHLSRKRDQVILMEPVDVALNPGTEDQHGLIAAMNDSRVVLLPLATTDSCGASNDLEGCSAVREEANADDAYCDCPEQIGLELDCF